MEWASVESELQNKIRWAIASTVQGNGVCNLSYRDSAEWGRKLARSVVTDLKVFETKPDYAPWLDKLGKPE
jgi:hypothetical protein